MHAAQKVAILAMIQTIETQLLTIRGLMGYDASAPAPVVTPTAQPTETNYMSETEEQAVDREIEKDRTDSLAEADIVQRRWQAQRKAMDEALEGTVI